MCSLLERCEHLESLVKLLRMRVGKSATFVASESELEAMAGWRLVQVPTIVDFEAAIELHLEPDPHEYSRRKPRRTPANPQHAG